MKLMKPSLIFCIFIIAPAWSQYGGTKLSSYHRVVCSTRFSLQSSSSPDCWVGTPNTETRREAWKNLLANIKTSPSTKGCTISDIESAMVRLSNVGCHGFMISSKRGLSAAHCFISHAYRRRASTFTTTGHGNVIPSFNPEFKYKILGSPQKDVATFEAAQANNPKYVHCLRIGAIQVGVCKVIAWSNSGVQAVDVKLSRCEDRCTPGNVRCAKILTTTRFGRKQRFHQGDSGSPLVCKSAVSNDSWYIRGIVSYLKQPKMDVAYVELLVNQNMGYAAFCHFG